MLRFPHIRLSFNCLDKDANARDFATLSENWSKKICSHEAVEAKQKRSNHIYSVLPTVAEHLETARLMTIVTVKQIKSLLPTCEW